MEVIARKEAKERGLKRYFTGKPCKHGHVSERDVSDRSCVECKRERSSVWVTNNRERKMNTNALWRENNKERIAIAAAEWYARNKEKTAITRKEWYARNKEKRAISIEAWRENNKEKWADICAAWRVNNKERTAIRSAKWCKDNPDKMSNRRRRRRARKAGVPGSHTSAEVKALLVQQDYRCANPHCNVDLRVVKKHLDHKNPLSRPETNPTNSIENLQWLCQSCNDSKGTKTMEKFLKRRFKCDGI